MEITKILVEKNVPCKMRDGVILYADIYRPDKEGKFPVLLTRHPYGKDLPFYSYRYLDTNRLVQNGFVVINQDCRGRFNSEGEFDFLKCEADDGYDTVEWAATLPFSTGKVGMFGMSYYGFTQLYAASTKPPHLEAIAPVQTGNSYHNILYRNGAFQLGLTEYYALGSIAPDMLSRKLDKPEEKREAMRKVANALDNIEELFHFTPYNQLPILKELGVVDYFFESFEHPLEDEAYWNERSMAHKFKDLQIPALHISGWYDCLTGPTLTNYIEMAKSEKPQRLIVGPWAHALFSSVQGECSFGSGASGEWLDLEDDLTSIHIRWFNYWLKGIDNGVLEEAPVKLFVMGANKWRDEMEWPLARTQYTNFYLSSKGKANTRNGNGALSINQLNEEISDTYIYDPTNPVPTMGGSTLLPAPQPVGPIDQSSNEDRDDVLVYSSEPLTEPIEVTGPITVKLWASTDVKDTDFIAKLIDTNPNGKAIILTEGIVNAKYRNGNQPEKELNGEVVAYEIDVWSTSNVFLPGHKITLEISSSSFPQYAPNPNTGKSLIDSKETIKANQTIYHSEKYPSHIILPIVPIEHKE